MVALRPLPRCLKYCFIQVTALSLVLCLAGCHPRWNTKASPSLPYKVSTASDPVMVSLQDQLRKRGLQVVTMGQDYLIRIPSTVLFANESPRLTWESYATLNEVICFLQQFRKIAIHITAYSNKYVSPQREHALTLGRARAVGDYLWSQGIDSRFIFTRGLGSDKPITTQTKGGDGSPNSRIEITFRDAVA